MLDLVGVLGREIDLRKMEVIDFDSRKIEDDGEVIKVMALLHVLNLRIFAIKLMSPMSFLEIDGKLLFFCS